ncbi:MAG TPA: sensor domain-containing diguanylate cyclase, partial [Actinomycetota bacterium]
DRKRVVILAAAVFAAVFGLRLTFANPQLGISFLYVAPIVLLTMSFDVRGALWAVVVSMTLTIVTSVLRDSPLSPAAYAVRGTVFVFVGMTSAVFRRISLRLEQESAAWFEQDIDLHCIANMDGYFIRVNDAFVRALGYPKAELLAKPFIDFVHPEDRDRTIAETMKLANSMGDTVDFENRYRAADGSYYWLRWSATPVHGRLIYASARDVTSQKNLEERLEQLATTDSLTGLANRRRFEEEAARTIDHIARYGTRAAALMIDLDGFKEVNDRAGHQAGDEVLKRVADNLRRRLRSSDLVARLGGDEFVVLLTETGVEQAALVAEALIERITECGWQTEDEELPVSASIGVALFDSASRETLSDVVRRADNAMFEAKRAGGHRYQIAEGVRVPAPHSAR